MVFAASVLQRLQAVKTNKTTVGWRQVLTTIILVVLAQLFAFSIADAHNHIDEGAVSRLAALGAFPSPPIGRPSIAPPLTFGFHKETTLPPTTEKWIDVDLSEQRVVAYNGTQPVRAFIVSTGLPRTPTVQGAFRIWIKTRVQDMSGGSKEAGDYYYLEDVEWVQYFYDEYAFHGAYWHNKFGQPMSRGCINMRNEDAKWLFEWASPGYAFNGPRWQKPTDDEAGTLVVIHE